MKRKIDNYEQEVERARQRRDELVVSDPTVHRYGDQAPEDGRDVYSVYLHREDYGGGYVAHLWRWESELRYRALYGAHAPESLWSYDPPAGAKEIFE